MLTIRFLRVGKKHQPSFKIVLVDKRRAPTSRRFIEELGFYNPFTKEKLLRKERIEYWLSKGAHVSDTVHNLLVKEGVIKGSKISVHKKKEKKEEAVPEKKPEVAKKPEEAPEVKKEGGQAAEEKVAKTEVREGKPVKEEKKEEKAEKIEPEGKKPAGKEKKAKKEKEKPKEKQKESS